MQELKASYNSHFLTFTYADKYVNNDDPESLRLNPESGLPQLCRRDVQLFLKKLRHAQEKHSPHPLRYYLAGEYGTRTLRPHYHCIMFNLHQKLVNKLDGIWSLGMVDVGTVEFASIHYVTKYVINRQTDYPGREPPFSMMSKRPGIGSNYLQYATDWHRDHKANFVNINGTLARLPRIYKDKIWPIIDLDNPDLNRAQRHKLQKQNIRFQKIRDSFAADAVTRADADYWKEVERLLELHPDPESYMESRTRFAHDSITSKINSSNQF